MYVEILTAAKHDLFKISMENLLLEWNVYLQSSPRPSPRVSQLKQEEIDVARSEAAHEKEIHSAIQMSQSCEDLTLVAGSLSCSDVSPQNIA